MPNWFKRNVEEKPKERVRSGKEAVTAKKDATRSTRETEADYWNSLFMALDIYRQLPLALPFTLYDYVEILAFYNADFGQAVDNISTLANPGYKVLVAAQNEKAVADFKQRLNEKAISINKQTGGFHGIITQLLRQAAIYGAMAGEWLLTEDLKDVVGFAFVNPKNIRFFFNDVMQEWEPYQKVGSAIARDAEAEGQTVIQDCIKLNTKTFIYQSTNFLNNNPYGIPPFLNALENIGIQRYMMQNLKEINKKLGLVGIIDIKVQPPFQLPDEDNEAYQARCQTLLQSYQTVLDDLTNKGAIAHFDDSEITNLTIADKVAGADRIFKLNEEQVFSGLKSLPSVQGRSYSTTETYAGVAYEVLLRSLTTYTNAVKNTIELGAYLMATVWGSKVQAISFNFLENKSLHRLQNAQAELMEYQTNRLKWGDGILDQTGVANLHNVDVPARQQEMPNLEMKMMLPPGFAEELDKLEGKVAKEEERLRAKYPIVAEVLKQEDYEVKEDYDLPTQTEAMRAQAAEYGKELTDPFQEIIKVTEEIYEDVLHNHPPEELGIEGGGE